MTNVVDNGDQAGVATQPSSSGGRSSGRGLSASASRSSEGEVRLLKRKLSYSVRKAVRKSDEVKCLKEVNSKLKVDIEEEVRRGKRVKEKHHKEVHALQADLSDAQDPLKDRVSRFMALTAKLKSGLNAKIEKTKAHVAVLENEKRVMEVNAGRAKTIAMALVIKEGEEKLDECRREHSIAWQSREASEISCYVVVVTFINVID